MIGEDKTATKEPEDARTKEANYQKLLAEIDKAKADADKAAADARNAEMKLFSPDFSQVERGSLELQGEQPIFGSAIADRALDAAATGIVEVIKDVLQSGRRVLVTSDAELAQSNSAYLDVVTALRQLISVADDLLGVPSRGSTREAGVDAERERPTRERMPLSPLVASAAIGALPGLISLFSARRTMSTSPVAVDDLAAAAAVAGAVKFATEDVAVVHNDIRLIREGDVHGKVRTLTERRLDIASRKLELESEKATKTTQLAQALDKIDDTEKALDALEPGKDSKALTDALRDAREQRDTRNQAISAVGARLGQVDAVLAAIDSFVASLHAVPAGAKSSPLTLAALHEELHGAEGGSGDRRHFTHVLFVKGRAGSATQTVDDRFIRNDSFHVVATASISYVLLDTGTSEVVAAGNAGGSASGGGSIGDSLGLEIRSRTMD